MRFLRFVSEQYADGCFGMLEDDNHIRVLSANALCRIEKTDETCSLSAVTKYLPPVDPPNIIAIGVNYREHAKESDHEVPKAPLVFIKMNTTITAHKQPVVLPREAPSEVDYEVELGVVIKNRINHVSEKDALQHVFGYTIAQDISARDCQLGDGQWARGKSFDTFCPIGPWVETEIDPTDVMLRTTLNGEVLQEQSTKAMVHPVASIISYLSRMMTLMPGTLILTGTPHGVGFTRKPPVYLRNGDELVSEIDGIGRMENPVILED